MAKKKIVIGVIGSDCHTVGNKIIHNKLEESGFDVVNIGALSPQIDFINAALETNSDAIIVSSIYGYGELDCQGIREKCNEYGLKDILLYVGGSLPKEKTVLVATLHTTRTMARWLSSK